MVHVIDVICKRLLMISHIQAVD